MFLDVLVDVVAKVLLIVGVLLVDLRRVQVPRDPFNSIVWGLLVGRLLAFWINVRWRLQDVSPSA